MNLYGKKPVMERIKARPQSIRRLYLQKRTDLSDIVREIKKISLTFESVDKKWFEKSYADVHTQGIVAEVDEFQYAGFSGILTKCVEGSIVPVFLDGVTDPQNLGSIIRNLACLGGFSLVLPEHEAAHVNETVLRVACGGENYIKIAKVGNIASAVKKAKEKGIWITGALVEKSGDIQEADLTFPLAAVIGSEGKGIRPGIRKHLDISLSLPMKGASLSYNVAVAASIFCYEINRRR